MTACEMGGMVSCIRSIGWCLGEYVRPEGRVPFPQKRKQNVVGQHIVTPLEAQSTATSSRGTTGKQADSRGRSQPNLRSFSSGLFPFIPTPKCDRSHLVLPPLRPSQKSFHNLHPPQTQDEELLVIGTVRSLHPPLVPLPPLRGPPQPGPKRPIVLLV